MAFFYYFYGPQYNWLPLGLLGHKMFISFPCRRRVDTSSVASHSAQSYDISNPAGLSVLPGKQPGTLGGESSPSALKDKKTLLDYAPRTGLSNSAFGGVTVEWVYLRGKSQHIRKSYELSSQVREAKPIWLSFQCKHSEAKVEK